MVNFSKPLIIFLLCFLILFTVTGYSQPTISALMPRSGPIGTAVTITGNGFNSSPSGNIVYFGAVRANVTMASTTSLTVTVPVGTTYEPISVTTNNLTVYSNIRFNTTLPQPGLFTPTTLAQRVDIPTGSAQRQVKSCDFDNDGKSDVAFFYDFASGVQILKNTSTASNVSFSSSVGFSTSYGPSEMSISDLDGDGKKDILISYSYLNSISFSKNISDSIAIGFAPVINITIPAPAGGVTASDINNDGRPDIVYTTNDSSKVGVLKNTSSAGNISFASAIEFLTVGNPGKIICSDLDNDSKEDIIILNTDSGSISVFRNTSNINSISFSARKDYATGDYPLQLATGDIDGDGKTDIAVVNTNSNNVSIFRNTSSGAGVFLAVKTDFTTGANPTSLVISDMNGDGKPDLATTNSNANTVSLLRNTSGTGTIAFNARIAYITGNLATSIVAIDANSDNKMDIITGNSGSQSFSVLLSRVNEPYISAFNPIAAVSGDTVTIVGLNFSNVTSTNFGSVPASSFLVVSDTIIKAIVGSGASGNVGVANTYSTAYLGGFFYGSNVPLHPLILGFSPYRGAIGTIVTITGHNFNPTVAGNIVRFGSVNANILSATSDTIKVAVPTGTTFTPISVSNKTNNLTGYSGSGFDVIFPGGGVQFVQNSFNVQNFNSVQSPFSITDIDGDGKPDYAGISGTSLSIKKNTSIPGGSISFTSQLFPLNSIVEDLITHDFNGDGKADIVTANRSSSISVLQNNCTPTNLSFSPTQDYTVANADGMSAGDLNNDGKADIVVLNGTLSYTNDRVRVFRNTSTGLAISFAPAINFETGSVIAGAYNGYAMASAIADLNGDGLPEIIVALSYSTPTLSILKNTSTNNSLSFAPPVNFVIGGFPRQIAIGDFSNDGKPDIAVVASYREEVVSILKNISDYSTGVISLANKIDYPVGNQATGVAIGDLDGDGKPDFAVTQRDYPSAVRLFRNTGTATSINFAQKIDIPIPYYESKAFIVDVNADGKPDVVTTMDILLNNIGGVLPLKLVSLSAERKEAKSVKLLWTTANEQNVESFQVEHSIDGNVFTMIGSIKGANAISGNSYFFIHTKAVVGMNYYRLKMLDKDGKFSYSYTIKVLMSNTNNTFSVYPTAAKDFVIAEHPASNNASIKLVDMSGMIVRTVSADKYKEQTKVSLEGISAGMYAAIWSDGTTTLSTKFFVDK